MQLTLLLWWAIYAGFVQANNSPNTVKQDCQATLNHLRRAFIHSNLREDTALQVRGFHLHRWWNATESITAIYTTTKLPVEATFESDCAVFGKDFHIYIFIKEEQGA